MATHVICLDGTNQTTLATNTIGPAGGSQPHDNIKPLQAVTYCIALEGHTFPVPKGVELIAAGGLPEVTMTVWINVFEHGALKLRDGDRRQRAAVALADRSTDDGRPRFRSKIQEPERVGDRDAALPHALGDLLVGKSKAVDQLPIRRGLFDRIQVGSLDVLDQRQLKHALIRAVTNHGRNRRQAGLPEDLEVARHLPCAGAGRATTPRRARARP